MNQQETKLQIGLIPPGGELSSPPPQLELKCYMVLLLTGFPTLNVRFKIPL